MGSAIKQRTFADWGEPPPGYCETDLVEHCGGAKEGGNYVHTLTLTDIHSGWTECAALVVREQSLVVHGINAIAQRLPFILRGLDTDNDSAFMNQTLQAYCREHEIEWTRSRAYRKNDQAWVEQKNGAVVRRLAGYARLSGIKMAASLAQLYASAREYVNFFQPSFKLATKRRDGAFVHKSYYPPLTPYQRLLVAGAFDEAAKRRLSEHFATLDPVALLKSIRDTQQELAAICDGSVSPEAPSADLAVFVESLASAWRNDHPPRRQRRKNAASKHWWRTRIDPFADSWPLVDKWLVAEPHLAAKELLVRLREQLPTIFIPPVRNCAHCSDELKIGVRNGRDS